jgi:hypothetical protein
MKYAWIERAGSLEKRKNLRTENHGCFVMEKTNRTQSGTWPRIRLLFAVGYYADDSEMPVSRLVYEQPSRTTRPWEIATAGGGLDFRGGNTGV